MRLKQSDFQIIENVLTSFPEGASIEEILSQAPGLARRTLVRRLSSMTQLGQLAKSGQARATRYRLVVRRSEPAAADTASESAATPADGLPKFIELERRFAEYDAERQQERDDWTFAFSGELYAPYTWDHVLAHRATVIVAEAGTGKSAELRRKTVELREGGKAAFFCRLEDLASMPLASAIEIGAADELSAWLRGNEEGWFFLDAVDEAKLVNPRQFEWAMARFAETISPHRHRSHVVISTRPHAWGGYAEREMLCRRLGLRLNEDERVGADDDEEMEIAETLTTEVVETAASSASDARNKLSDRPLLYEWQLAPLNEVQIGKFAAAHGVDNVEVFITEIEEANADVFANRPDDLPGLIKLWRTKKRIGSYSEVVLRNIQLKLGETNPRHRLAAVLPPDRALLGAERLAAAVAFTRKTSLLLPECIEVDPKAQGEVLDPRDVLLDWKPTEIQELLGRALFDQSLYGTVRFHHRTAREYLAARWLCRLLGQRKHRRSIQNILFAHPYGTEKPVVVPSVKPIAAWLVLWDQDVRDQVLRVDPKVLLEFGDAGSLGPDIRSALLRDFARRYAGQNNTPLSLHIREVRRLADPRLVGTIRALLVEYRSHDDVRQLLLRVIREGKLKGCGDIALTFATDAGMDTYTRTCAIQAIGAAGTDDEKFLLKQAICAAPTHEDRSVISALIEALFPTRHLTVTEVLRLFEAAPAEEEDTADNLQFALERLIKGLDDVALQLELLDGIVALLKRPPLKDEWCPISPRYAWLVRPAYPLAIGLVSKRPKGPFDPAAVAMLGMAAQTDHLRTYVGDAHKDALELINNNRALGHCIFWHDATEMRRRRPIQRVTDLFQLRLSPVVRSFDEGDAIAFLEALKNRQEPDDRLLALSVLMWIYGPRNRQERALAKIKAAVNGEPELERAFADFVKPREPSQENRDSESRWAEMERQRVETQAEAEQKRQEGIAWLRSNVDKLKVDGHAKEGGVLDNIRYLHHEITKSGKNSSRWTVSNWQRLTKDFGEEVARAFRDYCVGYWRLYQPSLRSEIGRDSNSTPWAVVVGLSGLAMEAAADAGWTTKLKPGEVARAVRYALWELNDVPTWLTPLASARPEAVMPVLLGEIVWELTRQKPDDRSNYVLSRLRWSAKTLGQMLRPQIVGLLGHHDVANARALEEALTLVLGNPAPLPNEFIAMAAKRADDSASDELKALWLAALLCLDARFALPRLESWAADTPDTKLAEHRISLVLNHVWGERLHGLNPQHQTFRDANLLLRLIKLSHTHVRLEDDVRHRGVYSPGERDRAQDARNHLLRILCELPGRATYEALLELSEFHPQQYPKDRMLVLAERRAEADAEQPAWDAATVAEFATDADYTPRTPFDLFRLALWRLDDLKLGLEEGDESEASVLQRVPSEVELRRVFANRLKHTAAGKYATGSEEELADASRTDVRLHHPAVDTRIPIELKIADKDGWSANALRERLENQLIGQYLRESRYGIFLLVRRGNESLGDKGTWRIPGRAKPVGFDELVAWLETEATELCRAHPNVDGVAVVGIDLTRRRAKKVAAYR
jgi:hypothetical protein